MIAFIILCCYSEEGGIYKYEASEANNPAKIGTLHSTNSYQEGDTVTMISVGKRGTPSEKI